MKELSPLRLTEYSHGAGCACKLSPIELGLVLFVITFLVLAASKLLLLRLQASEGSRS